MGIIRSVHQLVGQTPLMEITSFSLPKGVRLFTKLEFFNPGGSVKDRLGLYFVEKALKEGKIKENGTIIEPTAGNTGIGLALAAIKYPIKAVFVTPEKFSQEKQMTMRALGAEVINTPSKLGMKGAIEKAKELASVIPNSFFPNQFGSEWNPEAYYHTLGPELMAELDGKIDVFIAGGGSGGTFMGVSRYLKERIPAVQTMIVEPEGSILNGGEPGPHDTEGIGMECIPPFLDCSYFNRIWTVSDEAAFRRVAELAKKEGLLVGSSSGAVFDAALQAAAVSPPGTNIVTIFPDGSDRYMSCGIFRGAAMK
jgi:O-acetylserine dependent cystathionine beta-synthase